MKRHGFTLIEILIVGTIIVFLALAALFTVNYFIDRAQIAATKANVRQLAIAIKQLQIDTRQWPERSYASPSNPTEGPIICNIAEANFRSPMQVCVPPTGGCDYQNQATSDCLTPNSGSLPLHEYAQGIGNIAGALDDYQDDNGNYPHPEWTDLEDSWAPSLWAGLTGNPGRKSCTKTFTKTCTTDAQCPTGEKCYDNAAYFNRLNDMNPYPNWRGPYISQPMYDAWGRPFFADCNYKLPNTSDKYAFAFGSLGPDGVKSTSDDIVLYNSSVTQASGPSC